MKQSEIDKIGQAVVNAAQNSAKLAGASTQVGYQEQKPMQAVVRKIDNGFLVTPGGGIGYNSRETFVKTLEEVPAILKKELA